MKSGISRQAVECISRLNSREWIETVARDVEKTKKTGYLPA